MYVQYKTMIVMAFGRLALATKVSIAQNFYNDHDEIGDSSAVGYIDKQVSPNVYSSTVEISQFCTCTASAIHSSRTSYSLPRNTYSVLLNR